MSDKKYLIFEQHKFGILSKMFGQLTISTL